MINKITKCDSEILFKITKKEADFAFKLPKHLQDEFEVFQKQRYKFHCLAKSYPKLVSIGTYNSSDPSSLENQ